MASFTSYGATINVPDAYAAGHALTEKEAAALNTLRTELISHRVRAAVFGELHKGDTASPEQTEAAQAKANEIANTFEFGAGRVAGEPRVVDPVEKEARDIAKRQVMAKVAQAGLKVGKKAAGETPEETGDGIYAYSSFVAKVAELAQHENIVARAKAVVKARNSDKASVDVEL